MATSTDPDREDDRSRDRERSIYVGACRIELVRRAGTRRLLSDAKLGTTVARALEAAGAPAPASLTVVLTDDDELRDLNRIHLDRDEPTDVLSFPMLEPAAYPDHPGKAPDPGKAHGGAPVGRPEASVGRTARQGTAQPGERVHIGDIAISVERAIEQAEAGRGGQTGDIRWSPADEIRLLVTHGVLHLCGWDHAAPEEEAAMRALEQTLLSH